MARSKFFIVGGILVVTMGMVTARAASVEMTIPPGKYQRTLGDNSIPDPSGKLHRRGEVSGHVVVAIFSAPNMSQGDVQQKWADLLADNPSTRVSSRVKLMLVEDMSQAGMFKGMARDSMKKDFTPTSRPFLVIDETGDVFKRFGVPRGRTEILIYDKKGTLRDVETDLSDTDKVAHRVKVITARLLAE